MRHLLPVAFTLTLALATACDRGSPEWAPNMDASRVSSSGGEVALTDGGSMPYGGITSERFRQWEQARRGLDRKTSAKFGDILKPASPSARSIADATAYLSSQPGARQSIESAGMSVRAFVEMTVALEQQMQVARNRGSPPPPPEPLYPLPAVDTTTYAMPPAATPAYPPMPPPRMAPVDSGPRIDTVFVPPTARPAPPRADTSRHDITTPARDSAVTPPPARPAPRDTSRDTLPSGTTPAAASSPAPVPPDSASAMAPVSPPPVGDSIPSRTP